MATATEQFAPNELRASPVDAGRRTDSLLDKVIDATNTETQHFEFQQRSARLFATSGLFADIKGTNETQAIAQAFVKISLGESMGFNPAESMTGIDIIQGRVAVSANMRAARMQRAGYDWDILQLDDKGCRLQLKFQGRLLLCDKVDEKTGEITKIPAVVSFTEQDAARAGLLSKDNYKKNPRNMFFARAITNAQRWYAPGILSLNILSTEEAANLPTYTTSYDEEIDRLMEELHWPSKKRANAWDNYEGPDRRKELLDYLLEQAKVTTVKGTPLSIDKVTAIRSETRVEPQPDPQPEQDADSPQIQGETESEPQPEQTSEARPVEESTSSEAKKQEQPVKNEPPPKRQTKIAW